jgi:hypothetical protein
MGAVGVRGGDASGRDENEFSTASFVYIELLSELSSMSRDFGGSGGTCADDMNPRLRSYTA